MSGPTLSDVMSVVTAMHGTLAQMREELTGFRGELTGLHGGLTGLRGELDGVKQEQVRFGEELTRLRVDVMDRMDRLQDNLTAFRDDNFVTYARVERLDETTRASVQGFEKEISGIHRQIRNLQEEVRQLRGER